MPIKKCIGFAGFFLISYGYGILTIWLEVFPYSEMRYAYELIKDIKGVGYDEKNRQLFTESPLVKVDKSKNIGVFLTFGQSNASNHGQYGYEIETGAVYMFMNGETYLYQDPAVGGSGSNGSVWGRLGDLLISEGHYESVIFAVTGYEGRTIGQLGKPPYIDFMLSQYYSLVNEFGEVDAFLIHQGESNHKKSTSFKYGDGFGKFMDKLPVDLKNNIFLSRTSYCGAGNADPDVTNAQDMIINSTDNVYPGPNTDLLMEKKYRLPDQCHFSSEGFEKFAMFWLESLEEHLIR
ncbi:MAG: hypothetical protein ACQEW7_09430 [Pseudomonadota bacterium]